LTALWLPILLSAVAVFIISSIIHMLTPWHKGDYRKMPGEGSAIDALRPLNIPPGDYRVPYCGSIKEMNSPEFLERLNKGPVMLVTMLPSGIINIGKSMIMWFIYTLAVGLFAAYVAGRALPPGAPRAEVFRFTGTTAFLGYAMAWWQVGIWDHRAWGTVIRVTIDGLIYGLATAAIFAMLWPG
jgi:hypothetical protein